MNIGVLTSSRADYGIYYPLLKALNEDNYFNLNMLVFGTHLSQRYGDTISHIEKDGFTIGARLETMPKDDSPQAISAAMAATISAFSSVWIENKYDLIFALGDRYEMFAAVASALPFNIPVAHLHGGETTLGAIDNAFRHSITHMSRYHFVTCEPYRKRVSELTGSSENIFNVGALSIDNLSQLHYLSKDEFLARFHIDLNLPTILVTFHPETVAFEKNEAYILTLIEVLKELNQYQIVITMPNADTMGLVIREHLNSFIITHNNAIGVESFGLTGYLTCMNYCRFMLGNTSSGFVEAAWFAKPVVNIGHRQKGRIETPNIYTCSIEKAEIEKGIQWAENFDSSVDCNIYGDGNAAGRIVEILKQPNIQEI